VWSRTGAFATGDDSLLTSEARVSIEGSSDKLRIVGDATIYGDQFATASIPVLPHTDYVAVCNVAVEQGHAALKVTSVDRKVALASDQIPEAGVEQRKNTHHRRNAVDIASDQPLEPDSRPVLLPFASGNRSEVRIVLSNNGSGPVPVARVSSFDVYEGGATRNQWTRGPRAAVRFIQKNLFTTSRMSGLILVGLALLIAAGRRRALAILLAVPLYYLVIHSPLSTEYKYILGIHYFLSVIAAMTLGGAGALALEGFKSLRSRTAAQR